jgi:Tol biopolymer transport system component
MRRRRHHTTSLPLCLMLAACGGGGSRSSPVGGNNPPVEILACRARVDSPYQFAEIALRSSRNLGLGRIADRTGTERNVRLNPDGVTVVFARERSPADPQSRELFVSAIDGSIAELRLTANADLDDEPCWSPDGTRVLFTSDRTGLKALWLIGSDGSFVQPFLFAPPQEADSEADWCRTTDRVVWSRRAVTGRHALWLAQGNGTGITQLTDGGPTIGADSGDREPAFSPDGSTIAFVRRFSPTVSTLCVVDIASGVVTPVLQPAGEVAAPRWAPTADRLFFGLAEPLSGRSARRLASAPTTGGQPVLLWPDERWDLEGFDLVPSLPPPPAEKAPQLLDVTQAQIQIAAASAVSGSREQLTTVDGNEFVVWTTTFEDREVAGINCRFDLPVAIAEDVLELRIRAAARTNRSDNTSVLRLSLYNPVDERFDTVVELTPDVATPRMLEFRTSSLRHVTREKQLRFTVIGDLPAGDTAQLRIDLAEVVLVARDLP